MTADRIDEGLDALKALKAEFAELTSHYQASLGEQRVSPQLRRAVKHIVEDARAALDWCAKELYERFGSPGKKKVRSYFPITNVGQDSHDFVGLIDQGIPGLRAGRPDLAELLELFQAHVDPENAWLPKLKDLCNDNKHDRLTPQRRDVRSELRLLDHSGTGIVVKGDARVELAPGASLATTRGMVVPGQQSLAPGQAPRARGAAEARTVTWVSFTFEVTGDPVLELLWRSVNGVEDILLAVHAAI